MLIALVVNVRGVILAFLLMAAFGFESRAGVPYLTIWNYHGQKSFKAVNLMSQKKNGKTFDVDKVGELASRAYGNKKCKSLLTYNQEFPLSIMEEWGYLSEEQVQFQENVEKTVTPDQVIFSEVSVLAPRGAPADEAVKNSDTKKGRALKSILAVMDRGVVEMRRSAMWMVSAMTLNRNGELVKRPMPWQNDPELKGNKRLVVDRDKYVYAWEFGRAGQAKAGFIEYNLRALTIMAHQEMKHLGAGPDDEGYVFIHSLGASRTKVFEEKYKAKRFPADWDDDENCILILKISDLIATFKPQDISSRVAQVIALSGGAVSSVDALNILDYNLTDFRTDLDLSGLADAGPIVIEDMSFAGYKTLIMAKLKAQNISQKNAEAIYRYLAQMVHTEDSTAPFYQDLAYAKNTWSKFASKNAVQISNVSEKQARVGGPQYLTTVIGGVYRYYINRLAANGVAEPETTVIDQQKIKFCVRTSSAFVSDQLTKMGSELVTTSSNDRWNNKKKTYFHFFTADQVRALVPRVLGAPALDSPRASQPGANDLNPVNEGYWYRQRLLAHPMQF